MYTCHSERSVLIDAVWKIRRNEEHDRTSGLVLLKNPLFGEGLGMDIHLRNMKMRQMWSYIDSASIRIGDDILEVKGGTQES